MSGGTAASFLFINPGRMTLRIKSKLCDVKRFPID
jgi:hypothetical protein